MRRHQPPCGPSRPGAVHRRRRPHRARAARPARPTPRPEPTPPADDYERPPLPEEAPPAPPDLPPWEVPAPHRDKLDELVENAKQLDNFRIK